MVIFLAVVHAALFLTLLVNLFYLRRTRRQVAPSDYPLVSILIPARNEAENLRRLLPSLKAQDYPAFEAILYDDESEDETWAVIQEAGDVRIRGVKSQGPPPEGWIGKVHALYQVSKHARGRFYLFLDADAELLDAGALRRIIERYLALPRDAVLTGMTLLRGGGKVLVSLVPNALLTGLPWPLVRRFRARALGALNGQFWMIDADHYRRLDPFLQVKNEVLEDVQLGRFFKTQGLTPYLCDVTRELAVYMYRDTVDAWRGFRKNAYLILGGQPLSFVLLFILFLFTYVLSPLYSPWFLLSVYVLKAATDRLAGFPLWVSLLAPLSFLLSPLLQLDSAFNHFAGRVSWKGRRVGGA